MNERQPGKPHAQQMAEAAAVKHDWSGYHQTSERCPSCNSPNIVPAQNGRMCGNCRHLMGSLTEAV